MRIELFLLLHSPPPLVSVPNSLSVSLFSFSPSLSLVLENGHEPLIFPLSAAMALSSAVTGPLILPLYLVNRMQPLT